MDDFMFFSIIGAAAAMVIAWLWVVVRAFQESVGWGFATLLLNPLALLYALLRPAKCKYPLVLFGVALVFLLVGLNYARSKDHPPVKRAHLGTLTPNPSIEGMPKRLRLLVTPHVKR